MRLIACPTCHTQYDVSEVIAKTIPCRCGETLENRPHDSVDAQVHRCGACGALVSGEAESCEFCGSAIVRDDSQLSLICPECFARNAEESRFCTACGVSFRPEAVRIDGHEIPCPVCSVLMPPRQVGGIGVNECGTCNGLWVPGENFDLLLSKAIEARNHADPAALMKLKPRTTGANPAAQRVEYRKCPECETFMLRRNFRKSSGVIIDRCNEHGIWLDADELEQIAGFLLSGGETSPLLRQQPRSAAEGRAQAGFARIRAQHRNASGRDFEGGLSGGLLDILRGLLKIL